MLFLEGSIESFFGKFSPGNNGENVYRIGNKDDIENVDDFVNVDTDGFTDIENVNQRAYENTKQIF